MATFEIPLNPYAEQFTITMANVEYSMATTWCEPSNCWVLSLFKPDGTQVLLSIPLIPGVDLFAQYPDLALGGSLIAQVDNDPTVPPSYENLGITGHVYFVPTAS